MNIANYLNQQQVNYARAVSICSIASDMGLQRFDIDDVVGGLEQRHQSTLEPEARVLIQQAIAVGCDAFDVFERLDGETFALTAQGLAIGRDWSRKIQAAQQEL